MSTLGQRNILIEIRVSTPGVEPVLRQPTNVWTVFARAWAARVSHSGRVFYQAQQRFAEMTELFNIPYISGITQKMQIVAGGHTYEILDVDDVENRHREINLACKGLV